MLSIVIPTLNAARTLDATLATLIEARQAGLTYEVVVSDGGSNDTTREIAERGGARLVTGPKGRGGQLAAGAAAATGAWLLFLHADTRLAPGWPAAVGAFCVARENAGRAGYFRLTLDDESGAARRVERLVRWRCRIFALPYGDQGLLIKRATYESIGGYRDFPLMEDVDLIGRLGRGRLAPIDHRAITSADRYRRDGWWRRPLRNLVCLSLYFLGVSPQRLVGFYR